MLTYSDAIDHVLAFGGTDAARETASNHRRAVQNAYRALATRFDWHYLWGLGRVTTTGAYTTGTVAYNATTRALTLTGGVWPSWAVSGYVYINNVPSSVASRDSDTQLTLAIADAPAANIAALTGYSLYRDRYALPADFIGIDEAVVNGIGVTLTYVHPRDWSSPRRVNVGPGQPRCFSIVGSLATRGALSMAIWPAPDAAYSIDFLYHRKPRALVYEQVTGGLVTTVGTAVTGSGTAFKAAMVGSIMRFADTNQVTPTGPMGLTPAVHEATITAVGSTTSLTIEAAPADDFDQVGYAVSDPLDIYEPSMAELFFREVELHWRLVCRTTPLPTEQAEYKMALTRAMESECLSSGPQAGGRPGTRRTSRVHWPFNLGE